MAQFRNLIVYDYAKIDPEIIHVIMQGSIDDLLAYMVVLQQNYL